jgi:hypothetical protein
MRFVIAIGLILVSAPALAETWATGDCLTQKGTKIKYIVNNGEGFITYDNDGPYPMFTKKDGNLGIITHVGNAGTMTMAIDFNTGRGYSVTRHDNGKVVEGNVTCKLSSMNR